MQYVFPNNTVVPYDYVYTTLKRNCNFAFHSLSLQMVKNSETLYVAKCFLEIREGLFSMLQSSNMIWMMVIETDELHEM